MAAMRRPVRNDAVSLQASIKLDKPRPGRGESVQCRPHRGQRINARSSPLPAPHPQPI